MSDKLVASEIVADIKRVASEIGKTPARHEYHANGGKFSERQIINAFGGWTPARQAAGLEESKEKPAKKSKAEKKHDNDILSYDNQKKLHTSFDLDIQPYAEKFAFANRHKRDQLVLQFTDGHSPFLHRFTLEVALDVAISAQPDYIILGGDMADFYPISDYNKDPRRLMSLEAEINILKRRVFEAFRQACPNAQIDFILGNHEWRLWKFLVTQAPALASLSCLQIPKLLGLEDYGINLVARRSLINSKASAKEDNFKRYGDQGQFVACHGKATGSHPAGSEFKKYGRWGMSGHVHRFDSYILRSLDGVKHWQTLGAGAQDAVGAEYQDDLVTQQKGFGLAHLLNGTAHIDPISTDNGIAIVGGRIYREKEFLGDGQNET